MTGGIDLTLSHSDSELFDELQRTLEARRKRNLVRSVYFDGEAALKDFGISLPPQMRNIGAAIGLTAKGVRALTDRSQFETFVSPSESLMRVHQILRRHPRARPLTHSQETTQLTFTRTPYPGGILSRVRKHLHGGLTRRDITERH